MKMQKNVTKKVALISAGKSKRLGLSEPMSIGFIGSYLVKNGIDAKLIDQTAGHDVEKELDELSPDIVGISATTVSINDAYDISKACKEKGITTVIGGAHADVLPEEVIEHADIVVKGEGELCMLKIVKEGIKRGIIPGEYVKNLDDIPMPMRVRDDMEFYSKALHNNFLHFISPKKKVASLITSRGCPYNCLFCHNSWKGIPFRFHSIDRVREELEFLVNDCNVEGVLFIDDNLFVNKPRLSEICKITKQLNLEWCCNSRVDNITMESLTAAKDAGCGEITFGFESGSQRILDLLNKRTTVEQNREAVRMCEKVGIKVSGSFIIGSPTETLDDIELTKKFVEDTHIDRIGFCIATPYPKTGLWDWCKEHNKIPEHLDWSRFDYINVPINCSDIPTDKLLKKFEELTIINLTERKSILDLISRGMKFPDRTIRHIPVIAKMLLKKIF